MAGRDINIVVTDDHKLFRKGIASLLEDFDFIRNIYEAGNGHELGNHTLFHPCDGERLDW